MGNSHDLKFPRDINSRICSLYPHAVVWWLERNQDYMKLRKITNKMLINLYTQTLSEVLLLYINPFYKCGRSVAISVVVARLRHKWIDGMQCLHRGLEYKANRKVLICWLNNLYFTNPKMFYAIGTDLLVMCEHENVHRSIPSDLYCKMLNKHIVRTAADILVTVYNYNKSVRIKYHHWFDDVFSYMLKYPAAKEFMNWAVFDGAEQLMRYSSIELTLENVRRMFAMGMSQKIRNTIMWQGRNKFCDILRVYYCVITANNEKELGYIKHNIYDFIINISELSNDPLSSIGKKLLHVIYDEIMKSNQSLVQTQN